MNGEAESSVGVSRGSFAATVALCAGFFVVSLPALHWYQFYNSIENIVIETVLEARRDGHWLVPRMLDEPRTRKPPLAVWATALTVRPRTVAELSDTESREPAYARLAREMRLSALVAACLTLAGAVALGRVLADVRVGLAAGVITATTLLFLRESRLATPDTHLAMWVTWCNVLLARAVVRGERWLGYCGAGVCLGFAMMTKGPVPLIQTIAPVIAFVVWNRPPVRPLQRSPLLPVLAGLILFLCIALPWPAIMLAKHPGVWRTWFADVTRIDAADPRPDPWHANLQIVRFFMPWTVWLVLGLLAAVTSLRRRERSGEQLAFWLVVVPLVVMSFFSERKPRYILPIIPAAAVVSALPLVHVLRGGVSRWLRWVYVLLHWGCVAALALAGMIVFAVNFAGDFDTIDGSPWLRLPVAVVGASVIAAMIVASSVLGRGRRAWPLLVATALAMLMFDAAYAHGNARHARGRSEMKPLADAIAGRVGPHVSVVSYFPENPIDNAPLDLSIYLNRVVAPVSSIENRRAPAVIVVGARGEPVAPAGSEHIGSSKRGRVTWHAYLLTSTNARE